MAIDEKAFKDGWALLCDRFNREPSKPVMAAYYQTLSAKLTTEEFRIACQVVFEQREFFPRPADFLEAVRPDPKAEAMEQWEEVQKLMRGNGGWELTDEGQRVVRLLGGETHLKQTTRDQTPFVRREFLQLYGDALEIARREERPQLKAGPEAKRIAAGVNLKALK